MKFALLKVTQSLRIPELIAFLGILIFIPGFIIVNVYLTSFGIHDFSVFRMKYLSAGFLFFGILAVYSIFVWNRIYFVEEDLPKIINTLAKNMTSKFWALILGLFSTFLLYADNAFGIVFASSLAGVVLFQSREIGIFFGVYLIFFLIDYPLIKLGKYAKYPKVTYIFSFFFYIISVIIFLVFVKDYGPRMIFWGFVFVTIAINFLLDLRKKKQLNGSYMTKLSVFDWIWVIILAIVFSASFGRILYGKISPAFGGGEPTVIALIIDSKSIPLFRQTQIKIDNNSSEDVLLLMETDKEIYITKRVPNEDKTQKALRINKNIIQAIVYK